MDQDTYRRTGDLRGLADIRLLVLDDGPGRGQRLLLARNAAGVSFEVSVDRGFDVAQLSSKGINLGWHSPNQMRFPTVNPDAEGGWGYLRNFDGFHATCGLDHYGGPVQIDASCYKNPHRKTVSQPLHGRVASLPGRLVGYGVDADRGVVWCEGTVRQTAVFGEVLQLDRRIELPIDGTVLSITDRVTNRGFRPTPHALLYHFNVGYPLLDADLTLTGVPEEFESQFRNVPRVPDDDAVEIVDVLRPLANIDGWSRVTVENPGLAGARGIEFGFRITELPELTIWRSFQSGFFALGIEPGTGASVKDGIPIDTQLLAPGEERSYSLELRLLQ